MERRERLREETRGEERGKRSDMVIEIKIENATWSSIIRERRGEKISTMDDFERSLLFKRNLTWNLHVRKA